MIHRIRLLIFIFIAFALSLSARAAEKLFISINTENTSIVLEKNDTGDLMFMHYGLPTGDASQYGNYNSYRRVDYGTDPMAYPARGGR